MTMLSLRTFGGTTPKINPQLIGNDQAQVADNVYLVSGKLVPQKLHGLTGHINSAAGNIGSLYRFGSATNAPKFLQFIKQGVSIVRGATANNTDERTFYSDGVSPKKFDASMVNADGTFTTYDLGVVRPSVAPAAGGNPNTDEGLNETTHYVCTHVTTWGEESAPNLVNTPAMVTFDGTAPAITVTSLPTAVTGNNHIVSFRLYRLATGYAGTNYQFVTEQPVGTASFTDNIKTQDLGETMPVEGLASPPATMQGLVAMPNGIMAAFNGSDLLFSEPYQPHAYPVAYMKATDSPIVGLSVFGNTLMVATTDSPYVVVGSHPAAMSMQKLEIAQSCVSRRSVVDMGSFAAYASPDGLVAVSAGGASIKTLNIIDRDQWQALNPSSIHAYLHNNKYIAFYDATATGGKKGGFILDGDAPELGLTWTDQYYTCGYADSVTDTLYLMTEQNLNVNPAIQPAVVIWLGGAAATYTWRSKVFNMPSPTSFSCAQVQADAYPVTARFYADGVLKHTQAVQNLSPFRLPSGFMAYLWEFEISGSNAVNGVDVANSMSELKGA